MTTQILFRNPSLCASGMGTVEQISRPLGHGLVPGHPALRHGLRGYSLRAGRANLFGGNSLPSEAYIRMQRFGESSIKFGRIIPHKIPFIADKKLPSNPAGIQDSIGRHLESSVDDATAISASGFGPWIQTEAGFFGGGA